MQGKKTYQEKLFNHFQLSERVPENSFYRRLKDVLHLDFLYPETKAYYGDSGQKSIDPVVFFKLCLVGYLENLPLPAGRHHQRPQAHRARGHAPGHPLLPRLRYRRGTSVAFDHKPYAPAVSRRSV